ncbi:uncharacterized protein TRIVIDRAFT_45127 [Trichoderma virens Gv29-8]|uniref:SnoaL-like domain-containing protein n=1 Tax=Hypocrea virens (strain Gv29-8 / FGSC 10586) TaxID=413071 RepID=G9N535_HYPVG|nr:uncharacterized protein TRIVIDRAFT_45127 [Trichoderma virens Gv29-8]EHK17880.1 hypothetical protein TRIVIDRAFT_45127 [Trichoderma virens Gv29-8]UKZ54256.1 hypothetical protein TrVGV298_008064 [Trichoderma virens]
MGCITEILARQAAIDVVLRYADALDRADENLFEFCFAEDATIDLSPFSVLGMDYKPIQGRKEITSACMSAVGTTMETTHSLTNFLVKLNEQNTAASITCYSESQHIKIGQAFHSDSQDSSLIVKCRYEATVAQQGSEWKIESLKVVPLWSRGSMTVFQPATE